MSTTDGNRTTVQGLLTNGFQEIRTIHRFGLAATNSAVAWNGSQSKDYVLVLLLRARTQALQNQ